jgi:LmbE family N-acetylglucosaminyl deacetylase
MYDLIYLSPHLDDAALSCGGQIAAATRTGRRVLVVSITAGDPPAAVSEYAHSLHTRWELAVDATAARRAEDRVACARLGADALHWDVPDCIYRADPATSKPFYTSDAELFGPVAGAEWGLVDALAAQMAELPSHGQLIAPLGVGNHVDHQLTRLAAERAFGAARLRYYEDYPYADAPDAVAAVLAATPACGWQVSVIALDDAALAAKCDAVAAYQSQLSTFFRDRGHLDARVRGYVAAVGGERLWSCRSVLQS